MSRPGRRDEESIHAMSPEPDLTGSVELGDYLGILRRRWLLIVTLVVLVGAAAMIWSLQRPPSYRATTSILVRPITSDQFGGQVRPDQLLNMANEQQVVLSTPVAAKVVAALHANETPEKLLERVSVDVPAKSLVLAIGFSDPVPRDAQRGANEVAKAYLDIRSGDVRRQITTSVASLERQVKILGQQRQQQSDIINNPDTTTSQRQSAQGLRDTIVTQIQALNQKIADLRQLSPAPGTIIQPAALPTTRSSPNHKVDLGIGLAVGLLLGVVVALVRDRTDTRLRGPDDLAERLDRPVLAQIPQFPRWRRSGRLRLRRQSKDSLVTLEHPDSPIAEAYRTLRIRLARLARQLDIKTVMVVSAGAGEGKSTTAANLAVVMAESGRNVLLISADLRRPRVHELFALPNKSGLSNLLMNENDASRRATAAKDREDKEKEFVAELWSVTPNLWLILSGPLPPHPSSLMDSDAMRQLLKERRDLFDFVLLDCPPALVVADSLALAPLVDAVLAVADAKTSSRSAVSQLGEQLEQVGGKLIGCVLNRSKQSDGVSYYRER
jgi:capsular exopolysaccharide synthesis family protein